MVLQKVKNIVKRIIGKGSQIPKTTNAKIQSLQNTPITSLKIVRSPIQSFINKFINVLTLGKWKELLKKEGFDKLFHVKLVINDKYALEKRPSVYLGNIRHEKDEEEIVVPLKGKSITIGELIQKGQNKMGDNFTSYSALGNNNCQNFIKDILSANGLLSSSAKSFLFQDLSKLVSQLPGFVKKTTDVITDTAGGVNEATSEAGVELSHGGILI
jgi:hypothetical protein